MPNNETVNVRYMVDDVDASIAFSTKPLGFEVALSAATFRNDIVECAGGKQVRLQDPSGNFVELYRPVVT